MTTMLNGYPVYLSEFMTDTKRLVIKRRFEPGQRKGKNAHRLIKVYRTPPITVPSDRIMLSENGFGRFIAMHPVMWVRLESQIRKMEQPQTDRGVYLYPMSYKVLRGL